MDDFADLDFPFESPLAQHGRKVKHGFTLSSTALLRSILNFKANVVKLVDEANV